MPLEEEHLRIAEMFGDAEVENTMQGTAAVGTVEEVEEGLREMYPEMVRVRWIVPFGQEPEES